MPPSSIDPPRPPQAPLARLLAEAALQRQGMLLGSDRADGSAPAAAPAPGAAAAPPPLPLPSADRVSVSPEARERARTAEAAAGGAGTAPPPRAGMAGGAPSGVPGRESPAAGRLAGGASPGMALPAPAATAGPGVVGGAGEAWPAGGVSGPMRTLLGLLAHRLGEGSGGEAVRVVAAQPWTAGLAQGLRNALAAQGGAAAALQTWRVGQGSVLAQDGERGFTFTLQVPAAWAERGATAAASASASAAGAATATAGAPGASGPNAASTAAPSLALPFPGRMGRLDSGVFALVLQQGAGEPGAAGRTSALLSLEFQPPPQAALYGREWMQQAAMRADPWLQMAALQAGGWRPEDEEAEAAARRGALPACDQPGCPYEGRAPCAQPFCLALRVEPRRPA